MSAPAVRREIPYRYRLMGTRCVRCGAVYHPPQVVCQKCGSREMADVELSWRGKLMAYTVIRRPPRGYEDYKPYIVGLVELEDGKRILTQIVDCDPEEVREGMDVEATFRRIRVDGSSGIIEYGYKFRPVIRWGGEGAHSSR